MPAPAALPTGPFTAAQAGDLGISRGALRAGIHEGWLCRPFRGVYLPTVSAADPLERARAAALVIEPSTVVCDRSAAWLHGVDAFEHRELDTTPSLETCVLPDHQPTERAGCLGRTRDLRPTDWRVIAGVRVTTPLRTALDLGSSLHRAGALAAMDQLARLHGLSRGCLEAELPRYRGRRGVVQLRGLVPLLEPLSESTGETLTRLALLDHGLPAPTAQHWVEADGLRFRLDLAYPRAKVAVEYDGVEFHQDHAADERRRAWLRARGWTVIVVDRNSFEQTALLLWIDEVRRALYRLP